MRPGESTFLLGQSLWSCSFFSRQGRVLLNVSMALLNLIFCPQRGLECIHARLYSCRTVLQPVRELSLYRLREPSWCLPDLHKLECHFDVHLPQHVDRRCRVSLLRSQPHICADVVYPPSSENFSFVFSLYGRTSSVSREEMRVFKKTWATFDTARTGYLRRQDFIPFFAVSL